jgi:YesN/AraC family two-component response regulator
MFKILLVEDNTAFRQSLTEIIHKEFPSIAIKEAADADEALRIIGAFLPDLIFMDIKLPNGNGLELTKKIKAEHPEMNVIVLTSYDFLEYREAALKYGASNFLSKASVTREEITALVRSFSE